MPESEDTDARAHEAAVLERTRTFLAAFDAAAVAGVSALLAPDFMRITITRASTSDFLEAVRGRHERGWPRLSGRTLARTRVRLFGDIAILTAMSSVQVRRAEGVAPELTENTETLVWVRRDRLWQLAHWQEEPAGEEMEAVVWNRAYLYGANFTPEPNKLLVETVRGREPGTALDVGVGQGRNALYLASQGWDVTGVDISAEGIRQARAHAERAGLKLHTVVADLATWDWGQARYDLIAFLYMGNDPDVARIRRALKQGGVIVIEFFLSDRAVGGDPIGFEKGALPRLFADGFTVLRYEEVLDRADWGLQRVPLVRFVAQRQ